MQEEMPISPGNTYVNSFDAVRGLCALVVVAYHFCAWRHLGEISSAGTFPVYTFFVLSAVTMLHRYGAEFSQAITWPSVSEFFRNRFARLFPLLAAAAVGAFVIETWRYNLPVWPGLGKTILTATGLFGLQMPGFLSNVTGAWSLGIELTFYAVFPVIALIVANSRLQTVAWFTLALILGQQLLLAMVPHRLDLENLDWNYYVGLLTFAPFFGFGALIYMVRANLPALHWIVPTIALAVMSGFSFVVPGDVAQPGIAFVLLSALSAVSVATAYRAEMPKHVAKIGEFLGEISYSLYLTHWFAYVVMIEVATKVGLNIYGQAVLFVTLVFGFAIASHRILERPARKLLRSRIRLRRDFLANEGGARSPAE